MKRRIHGHKPGIDFDDGGQGTRRCYFESHDMHECLCDQKRNRSVNRRCRRKQNEKACCAEALGYYQTVEETNLWQSMDGMSRDPSWLLARINELSERPVIWHPR